MLPEATPHTRWCSASASGPSVFSIVAQPFLAVFVPGYPGSPRGTARHGTANRLLVGNYSAGSDQSKEQSTVDRSSSSQRSSKGGGIRCRENLQKPSRSGGRRCGDS